ncbi:MAG: biotin/lipoyl-binding protein [Proteobacteria bacterium]|nr:biotin/lipoyl-binding protein [Pseudomonadota bacterium]
MNYQVSEKKGDAQTIGLAEIGEGIYEVTIEGQTIHVDAVKSGRTIYSIIEDGKQFEASVDAKGEHGFDVLVAGHLFHLESIDERTRLLAGSAQTVAVGKQTVEAEMPGKVVQVSAAPGGVVSAGQGVMIIEAMKMENEIPSPIAGVITEIGVAEGDTVEPGTVLFVVEPQED